jgi:PAS domain S-box-containing protein
MLRKSTSIQRKLMKVIMLTSGAVLLLTCTAYFAYEVFTFRQVMLQQLTILGEITAANSTAALAFENRDDANEILAALKADRHIVAAGLYDKKGNLFSKYPQDLPDNAFPTAPSLESFHFENSYLSGFKPVTQGSKYLGALYLKSDMGAMSERLRLYGGIAILVIVLSSLLAYLLSRRLQKRISKPILTLTKTVKAISERGDYSVRVIKLGEDELGVLTDAFNQMLAQIEEQNLELSESSARVNTVLNSALSAVILMDAAGLITYWNERSEKMFGWTREEAIGRPLAETIIPESFREGHRKGLTHFLNTGEGPAINRLIEMSALRKNGNEFPIELSINALKTGKVLAFCGFITDITERKHAEAEIHSFSQNLEQMVKERTNELETANKELEAFSYSVSHDLRAPLRSIHGFITIFHEDYGDKFDEEAKRLMSIIVNSSKKMGQLIDDLLDFSKLGRRELTRTNVNMNSLVAGIWDGETRLKDRNNLKLIMSTLPNANVDSITITQVWTNLISNAIKYSRNREYPIVEIGHFDKEGETVYYIRDNGSGFDMKYYDKLFGVFQRLHSSKEFEGTGVGLAIVHRIVVKHGGTVWAESKINEGTTFYFSIKNFNNQLPEP